MKLKTLQVFVMVCILTLSAGVLAVKAEGPTGAGIKATIMNKFEKKDVRNPLVEKAQQMRDMRASTTMMMKEFKGERKEMMQKMQLRMFEMRKNNLVKELTNTLKNLTNIRTRISDRITKAEGGGRDMTDAKAKLVIADAKLVTAQTAVNTFASFNYASTTITVTASSSAEVSLERPRKMGDDAIKAVKEARDAFKDVVTAIAHGMGLGNNNSTATTTATTTSN